MTLKLERSPSVLLFQCNTYSLIQIIKTKGNKTIRIGMRKLVLCKNKNMKFSKEWLSKFKFFHFHILKKVNTLKKNIFL